MVINVGLLVDCKGEAGVFLGEAVLEAILEGEGIGERKLTTGLVGMSKQEGVKCRKSSSGSERSERQSSQGGKIECTAA